MASESSRGTRSFPAVGAATSNELAGFTGDSATGIAININDPRYPRARWFRGLRTAAIRSPLALLLYPVLVVVNLILAVLRSGPSTLSRPATYLDATLRSWVAALPARYLVGLVVAIVFIGIIDLAYLSRLARRDERQEQAVMQERMIDTRLTQTHIDAVRFSDERLPHRPSERARRAPSTSVSVAAEPP